MANMNKQHSNNRIFFKTVDQGEINQGYYISNHSPHSYKN